MPNLYTQDMKNLVAGVSQQPPRLRYPEQLAEQINGFSSESNGLQQRPPTIHVKNLGNILQAATEPLVHLVNRDNQEKYMTVVTGTDILVFDLEGNQKEVKYSGESQKYLGVGEPRKDIRINTVADYSFFTNTTINTQMSTLNVSNMWDSQGYLVNIKSGQYGRTYQVFIDGVLKGSHSTPDGSSASHTTSIDTNVIVNGLSLSLANSGCIILEKGDSWFYFKPAPQDAVKNTRFNGTGTYTFKVPEGVFEISVTGKASGAGHPATTETKGATTETRGATNSTFHNMFILQGAAANTGNSGSTVVRKRVNVSPNETLTITIGQAGYTRYRIEGVSETVSKYGEQGYFNIEWGFTSYSASSVTTKDGYNGKAMTAFSKATQRFTDLPSTAPDGFTVEITGEPGEKADNYYVRFSKDKGVWEETTLPGMVNTLDTSTMPHALIREADGSFSFKDTPWESRTIGDEDSNPLPSFINYPIQDVFFHRSRIGFLSGENVILSRSSDIFNFWMTSASSVIDTDPIDLTANQPEKVSNLTYAVPLAESMVLFSDSAQFILGSEGALTPLTARVMLTTDYAFSPYVAPIGGGRNIYFTSERHQYASIKELYTMQNLSEQKSANDISAHIPNYIPKGVHQLLSGTTENILMVLTEGAPNKIFVYKYLFMEESRVQSSWSQWDFGTSAKILGGGFVGSILYLLIQRPEGVCLEKLIFTYNTQDFLEEPYRVFLDQKIVTEELSDSHFDTLSETTHINLENYYEKYKTNKELGIVMSDGFYRGITETEAETGEIILEGDWRGQRAIIGKHYVFEAELSEIMIKSSDERGGVRADTEGRLQLRNVWVNYADTGEIEATVEVWGKQPMTYTMTGKTLGVDSFLGQSPNVTGQFKIPVHSNSTACKIRFKSRSPLALSLIGAGWEGMIYKRSKRI